MRRPAYGETTHRVSILFITFDGLGNINIVPVHAGGSRGDRARGEGDMSGYLH